MTKDPPLIPYMRVELSYKLTGPARERLSHLLVHNCKTIYILLTPPPTLEPLFPNLEISQK